MGSESILSAFQSAFPSLYSAPAEETVVPDAAEPGSDTQAPVEPVGDQTAPDDPYSQKIKRITGKVSSTSMSTGIPEQDMHVLSPAL